MWVNIENASYMAGKKILTIIFISTSHIEQENLTLRQDNNRLTRKTLGYSKKYEWLQHHATLQMTDHNFVRTHDSLKKPCKTQVKGKVWRNIKNNPYDVCRNHRPFMDLGRITNILIP